MKTKFPLRLVLLGVACWIKKSNSVAMKFCDKRSKTMLRGDAGFAETKLLLGAHKIYVTSLRVCTHKFHAQLIAHVHALSMYQQAFNVRLEHSNKGSLRCSPGDNRLKDLPNSAAHGHRCNPF